MSVIEKAVDFEEERRRQEREDEEVCSAGPRDEPRVRIPEGEYKAEYLRGDKAPYKDEGEKIYLYFEIVEGEHRGVVLFRAYNVYDSYPLDSDYYKEWTIANGSPPKRTDRMTPRVFRDKTFLTLVRDTKPQCKGTEIKGEALCYSKIGRIIGEVERDEWL